MQQITIAKKLFIGCGAMLAITLVVGAIAIRNVGKLGESIEMLGGHYARAALLASDVHSLTLDLVSTSRGVLLRGHMKDLPRAGKLKDHYDEDFLVVKRDVAELSSLTIHTDVRDILQNGILGKLNTVSKVNDDLYESIVKGDLTTADTINTEKLVPLGASLSASGKELVELEAIHCRQYADEASSLIPSARNISLLMILLSVGVGTAVVWVVRNIAKDLGEGIAELKDGADQIRHAALQVSASSQSLAQGASEQAVSLEETSASSEEINSMARKNTDNSRSTAELLAQSQSKVTLANQHLAEMVISMNEITESSGKISKIIKVIDEIAFQTNILALNAAVEAARAGEAGMGFAVVADEVRSLAQRSAQAAKDTATLIEDSIARSSEGKGKVDQVALAILAVTEDSARIKVMVDEVSLGSEEQSRGIEQIGRAIIQMEQVTQSAAANAEQSAAAAQQLSAQSETMNEVVSRMYAMVDSTRNQGGRAVQAKRSSSVIPARNPRSIVPQRPHASSSSKGFAATNRTKTPVKAREAEFPMEDSFQSF